MNESVLDVLMFLLDHYGDQEISFDDEREQVHQELVEAGFDGGAVCSALGWLESLGDIETLAPEHGELPRRASMRVFTALERQRFSAEALGFLTLLGQSDVLGPHDVEAIIDRALALDAPELDLEELKWVVLVVLYNRPEMAHLYACIEELVQPADLRVLH